MIRKARNAGLSVGVAGLLGLGLLAGPQLYLAAQQNSSDAAILTDLTGTGTPIGFSSTDPSQNSKSFKVGTAEVETYTKADGTIGVKVISGSLTLKSATGEDLATLTAGDDVEIGGLLDPTKLGDLFSGNNQNVLRLGAVAAASITNKGPNPVNFNINGTAMVIGGSTPPAAPGHLDAAIGKVYQGTLPASIRQDLKKGESAVGQDGEGKPILISKGRDGTITTKSLDAQTFGDYQAKAGNALLDSRKVFPVTGVPIKMKIGETTVEITGTEGGGAKITVLDGPDLKLGTANLQYVGGIPKGQTIELSDFTMAGLPFFTPSNNSTLLVPTTAQFNLKNLGPNKLNVGTVKNLTSLEVNAQTTNTKCGFITGDGMSKEDLEKLPAGTGVEFTTADGKKVFMTVGDPLDPHATPKTFNFFNPTGEPMTVDIFGKGAIILPPGGGFKVPSTDLTMSTANNHFTLQMSDDALQTVTNATKKGIVFLDSVNHKITLLQGKQSLSQATLAAGSTSTSATFILGGTTLPPDIANLLQTYTTTGSVTKTVTENGVTKKVNVQVWTDSKGNTVTLQWQQPVGSGNIAVNNLNKTP